MRSDTFSPDGGITTPWASGIPLNAGQKYYIEYVHSQGTGGDSFSVTYKLTSGLDPTNGQPSMLYATNNNIAYQSYPDSTPVWTLNPTNVSFTANAGGGLSAIANAGGEFSPMYQWLSNNVPVPGATSPTYYNPVWPQAANGASYALEATGVMNGLSSTSSPAIVTVVPGVQEQGWVKVDWFFGGSLSALKPATSVIPPTRSPRPSLRRIPPAKPRTTTPTG